MKAGDNSWSLACLLAGKVGFLKKEEPVWTPGYLATPMAIRCLVKGGFSEKRGAWVEKIAQSQKKHQNPDFDRFFVHQSVATPEFFLGLVPI